MGKGKALFKRLFPSAAKETTPRREYSKWIWCSDCGEPERIWFPKMDVTTTLWEWLFDYRLPQGWRMVRVGLQLHFLCPDCMEKRRKWGQQFLQKENGK